MTIEKQRKPSSQKFIYKRAGSKYWQYTFNFRGKRYKGSTNLTSAFKASDYARSKRDRLIQEEVGITVWQAPPQFRDFVTEFLNYGEVHYTGRQSTLTFYKVKLKSLLSFAPLSSARIDQIDEALISRYKNYRKGEISLSTCNRELATLSVVLSLAFERKLIVRKPKIKKFREQGGRTFVLDRADEATLLRACPEPLADLVTMILDTGLRAGEALNLKWEDIRLDGDYPTIQVRRGKTQNAKRSLPVTERVRALLRSRSKSSESIWVFPGRSNDQPLKVTSADHIFRRVCVSLVNAEGGNLFPREFVLHSLRHTCLTRLGEAGVGIFEIGKLAGHAQMTTTQRYVHPSDDALRRAMMRLDAANDAQESQAKARSLPHSLPQPILKAA